MSETLNSFIAELSLSKSKLTVEAYKLDVERFLQYVSEKGIGRIKSLKAQHIVDYLGHCKAQGKSDSSVHRYFMALRGYCRYLRKSSHLEADLMQDVSAPRFSQKAPYVPTNSEISRILEMPDKEGESGCRDSAMLELLYSSGLRASELCDLKLEDLKEFGIVVKCGKRGKTRTVPLTESAKLSIIVYIETYRGRNPGYLFVTKQGKKIRRQLLCSSVVHYAKKAGIEGVTTHTLRHACATHLLDEGADLRLIQEVLGHSSIASTQRYTHLSSSKMQQMFTQFHPRKQKANVC